MLALALRCLSLDVCKLMVQGNIWGHMGNCHLMEPLDLAKRGVINVPEMSLKLNNNGTCMYTVLELSNDTTVLQNAYIYINATVQIPEGIDVFEICVFDSIAGRVENVTVAGEIRLNGTFKNESNYTLSTFAGRLFPSAKLSNVSSSLVYKLNGDLVNQTQTEYNTTRNVTYELSTQGEAPNLQNFSVSIPMRHGFGSVVLKSVDNSTNIDEQVSSYEQLYQAYLDTRDAFMLCIDSHGDESFGNCEQEIYYNGQHVYAFHSQQNQSLLPKICRLYDVSSKECVDACGGNMVNYHGICAPKCYNNYQNVSGVCYSGVPYDLGYDGNMSQCSSFVDVATQTCIDSCSEDMVVYNKACYKDCPFSTIQEGQQCAKQTACPDGTKFIKDDGYCAGYDGCPVGYYLEEDNANCVHQCQHYANQFTQRCERSCNGAFQQNHTCKAMCEYGVTEYNANHMCAGEGTDANVGLIVGVTIGVVTVLIVGVVAFVCVRRKKVHKTAGEELDRLADSE